MSAEQSGPVMGISMGDIKIEDTRPAGSPPMDEIQPAIDGIKNDPDSWKHARARFSDARWAQLVRDYGEEHAKEAAVIAVSATMSPMGERYGLVDTDEVLAMMLIAYALGRRHAS